MLRILILSLLASLCLASFAEARLFRQTFGGNHSRRKWLRLYLELEPRLFCPPAPRFVPLRIIQCMQNQLHHLACLQMVPSRFIPAIVAFTALAIIVGETTFIKNTVVAHPYV